MKKENKNKKNDDIEIKFTLNKGKILKGLGVIAVVLAIVGLSFMASKSYAGDTQKFEFINITIDEYLEKMKSEEKQIIYIARPDCSFCVKQTPILKKIGREHDLEVFYLDTSDFIDYEKKDYTEDGYKFLTSAEVYNEGYGTPNTIIVQNGEIVDGVYQYVESRELEDLFERNGFINE